MTPRERYDEWLRARGAGGEVRTGPRHGSTPYELFFVAGAPGQKLHPAAASAEGVVAPEQPEGWGAFLRSAEPAVLQRQIAWLHGAWVPLQPGDRGTADLGPELAAVIAAPRREERPDGGVVFEACYGAPPTMRPFRFRAHADGSGRATFALEAIGSEA